MLILCFKLIYVSKFLAHTASEHDLLLRILHGAPTIWCFYTQQYL